MKKFFSFPNPVNDAAARTVALGVVTMSVLAVATNTPWLLIPLTYGFVARVAAGPTISPLGQFAVRVAAPRLTAWHKSMPGPPKRFAQAMGAFMTIAATVVWLSAGFSWARWILVALIVPREGATDADVTASLADLRPYARMLVVASGADYIEAMLTALRA